MSTFALGICAFSRSVPPMEKLNDNENNNKSKGNKKLVILIVVLAAALLAALAIVLFQTRKLEQTSEQLDEVSAIMEYEKQQSISEYEQLAKEYDEFYLTVGNDSLLKLIEEEKEKVNSLLQELRTVKATNAKRISELKQELTVVRSVLKSYVQRYDSLNEVNASLKNENRKILSQYEEQNKVLEEKTVQIAELDKKISMASILEAGDISVNTLNSRGKKTNYLKRVETVEICFKILRNITAERGIKTIYLRFCDSSENLVAKEEGFFVFEDMELQYSAKKDIEFGGESVPVCIYVPLTERLKKDVYSIAIFAEGNLIGSASISLD